MVLLPLPLVELIVGAASVTETVGATVSTTNVERLALAAMLFPARSLTVVPRLTVYVPCALADQLAEGAVIVYVTVSPLAEKPVTVALWFTVMFAVANVLVSIPEIPSA